MTADTVPLTEAPAYQKETYILTGYRKSITLYDPIQRYLEPLPPVPAVAIYIGANLLACMFITA